MHFESQAMSRPVGRLLFVGVLLCFLSIWKGDGGYADLRGYLDNAERMWLRGDLSEPNTDPAAPKQYNRFSLGLPFLSAPFVYAGALIERLSQGAIGHRAVAALAVPFYGALACVLLWRIGLLCGFSMAASLWAACVFALGGPIVSYTRLYYAEVALSFCLLLGLWAHLRARAGTRHAGAWTLLAGAGMAGVMACHYSNVLLAALLWLGLTGAWVLDAARTRGEKVARAAQMACAPALTGLALLWINYAHYGHPFRTGYHQAHADVANILFSPAYVGGNLAQVGAWIVRVPWALVALALWIVGFARETVSLADAHADADLRAPDDATDRARAAFAGGTLRAGVAAAFAVQLGFWLLFMWFPMFGLRYQMPLMALAAPGLLCVGAWLEKRWPARGLALVAAVLFTWNLLGVLRGDDSSQIVFVDPLGRVCSYVWYMQPFEAGHAESFGTPATVTQLAIFLALALPGVACLAFALRRANAPKPSHGTAQ